METTTKKDVFETITQEETAYKLPIPIVEGYSWGMYNHITRSVLYKNSQLETGKTDDKPVKNIVLPILRLQYRTEGFDIKDIGIFINDSKKYFKSFLVRKFHEKWARDNEMDTFIDDLVESYVDFGGALVKDTNGPCPEVVPLQSIAFCDQTDMLGGPLGIKHNFSPDQLMEMADRGWGNESNGATATLEEVIRLAENEKSGTQTHGIKAKTPGKYIEVYEVHGMFPTNWLTESEEGENDRTTYSRQVHIVTFYTAENSQKKGICLYKGKLSKSPFKVVLRDKIHGRALGLGGVEELFEPQMWTTYDQIRIKGMLDQASKIVHVVAGDPTFTTRNKTTNLENGQLLDIADNATVTQLNTQPVNMTLFENNVDKWEMHAQQLGAANDAIQGKSPSSGTPFKLQDLVVSEAYGIHNYRQGKIATFVDTIYRDWIIPRITKEIIKGQEFMAELSLKELQTVADSLVTCQVNDKIKKGMMQGDLLDPEEREMFSATAREVFMKGGNKRFIEIFKDEMKDAPIDVYTNIVGKQKDKDRHVDKLVNIFRTIIPNPQILQIPPMAELFNDIIESSGLNPIDFSGFTMPVPPEAELQAEQAKQAQAPEASPLALTPEPAY